MLQMSPCSRRARIVGDPPGSDSRTFCLDGECGLGAEGVSLSPPRDQSPIVSWDEDAAM